MHAEQVPIPSISHGGALQARATQLGVALVALSTLLLQILLTRIFSVSMWYHFAFMAISLTLFGMTVGALLVYRFPQFFRIELTQVHLAGSALAFSVSTVLCFLTHLTVPFVPGISLVQLYALAFTYLILSIPFVFSGICISLAMTRFPEQVGRLYGADLAGAAIAGPLAVLLLQYLDAPGAIAVPALLAAGGATAFVLTSPGRLRRYSLETVLALAVLTLLVGVAAHANAPLFRLMWVKGQQDPPSEYERWNAFSRITVRPHSDHPFGWGLSDTLPPETRVGQKLISIDAIADTVLTQFKGNKGENNQEGKLDDNLQDIHHLQYDVTNLVHHLRPQARVLTIGVGGGRDILSALSFRQSSVTGVEINPQILAAVNGQFGDFTGHLNTLPGVTLINDEARSFLARTPDQFDIIQLSLIDTFAATAAGAYVLTENALYTREAWTRMLERLSDTGVLSVSRWYFRDRPGEMYRLTTLATETLRAAGIRDPRPHLLIVRKMGFQSPDSPDGVGTLLLSKKPFTPEMLAILDAVCQRYQFEVMLTPTHSQDPTFEALTRAEGLETFLASYPLDIRSPTDDRPFFFHMLRLGDLRPSMLEQGITSFNLRAVVVLGLLLFLVTGLMVLCVVLPLRWARQAAAPGSLVRATPRTEFPLIVYFLSIGFGFMGVEIAVMQRLNLFLGHPIYGMCTVLTALLLACGVGSAASARLVPDLGQARAWTALASIVGVTALASAVEPLLFAHFESSGTVVRIGVATLLLLPLGGVMGMAFPLGMRLAQESHPAAAPWLWGINGAASVCASVLAIAISLSQGITATWHAGILCYCVTLLAFLWTRRVHEQARQEAPNMLDSPTPALVRD